MSITLSPRAAAMVQERLESGRYASADEVIEAAVMLLEARERFDRLRASLIEAEEEIREGKVLEWTPELRQRLREEADEMDRQGVPLDPDVCP
jgi:putative addiction module CopG family antidote